MAKVIRRRRNEMWLDLSGKWWAFVANTCVAIDNCACHYASKLRMYASHRMYLIQQQRKARGDW